ncbi:hypothetical protein QFC21_002387 [Naganishia friedmannii]|uniref:Uncharacterized protein n=1 Tax=Naganishia friedmannii TaxID=89922 RepID=A0ACC2VXY8_9TREE|nr:hypothetical protein QFC21_002387 [Naganishia friedmannii]
MALISDTSYILDSLRRHHLQNCRNDAPSARLIKVDNERHRRNRNLFSAYVFAHEHASGIAKMEQGRNGRESPELAIDKELADYEGLRQRPLAREEDFVDSRPGFGAGYPLRSKTREFSDRYTKSSTATITPLDGLGTPFSVQPLDATPRTSEEFSRDPNVKLNYSKTIGKPTKGGLARFIGLRVDENQPLPSLPNPKFGRDQNSSASASASATPTQGRNELQARLQSGLSRRSTSSTLETFSHGPHHISALSSYASNEGQSHDRTPTGRSLSGLPLPVSGLRQPALSRIQRPRADSAPMVVISSPNGSGVNAHSPEVTPRNAKTEQAANTRRSFGHGHRKSSATSHKSHYRKSTAFSPSAIQSVLGEDENAIESDDENIPRPGEDPREHAKREQYGSILTQTLMSQTTKRPGFGLGRNLSLYSRDSSAVAEESEGSEMDGTDTDGYDLGDTSTDAPESQQSNPGIGNFDMGLTKADESVLGGLDLGARMSIPTSSYGSGKRQEYHPRAESLTPIAFEKQPVGRPLPVPSSASGRIKEASGGLSLLFHPPEISNEGAVSSNKSNSSPFSTYASVPPPHNSSVPSLVFSIYYPFSEEPSKPIQLTVRKEVTVEEVIGWALYRYCESERKPAVHEGHDKGPNKDVNPAIWRTTAGWALRIVEDDGEVDEDFPALDRESSVAKFAFGGFAVVEANPTQEEQMLKPKLSPVQQNAARLPPQAFAATALDPSAPNRPSVSRSSSRVSSANGRSPSAYSTTFLGGAPSNPSNAFGSSSTSGPSGMGGVMVHLKIRIIRTKDVQHITTITVPSEMYFADIIEVLIKKKRLSPSEPSEWALLLGDLSMVLPLDRTVESLMGNVDLALVTKSWAEVKGLSTGGRNGERRGGDPSTSIFKRGSEQNKPRYGTNMDYESTYRKYKVQRKMPIGKHERILAIDGDYIHVMPTDTRAFFDSMKTSSFHATSITACKQYAKSPSSLRIVVWRDGTEKRYEFEAESPRESGEIVITKFVNTELMAPFNLVTLSAEIINAVKAL